MSRGLDLQATRFVFWQGMLCIHQSAHARSLAELGHDVTVVVAEELSEERRGLGWSLPDMGAVKTVIAPDDLTMKDLAAAGRERTLHFIIGTRGWRLGRRAYEACRDAGAHVALIQESPDPMGAKGLARRLLYTAMQRELCPHVDFLLAMGVNGVRWYRACGWPDGKVFPYAYFTETPANDATDNDIEAEADGAFEIAFVGKLVRLKGVDILIAAMARLRDLSWRLTLIGDGPERAACEAAVGLSGLEDRIRFLGVLPNQKALDRVARSDLLVLPSRKDGWGAVVSEALMRGTPVVATERCGASVLLAEDWRGTTCRAGSVDALAAALRARIGGGKKTVQQAQRIRAWSRCIEGHSAANYILAVMGHVYGGRPRPPALWEAEG